MRHINYGILHNTRYAYFQKTQCAVFITLFGACVFMGKVIHSQSVFTQKVIHSFRGECGAAVNLARHPRPETDKNARKPPPSGESPHCFPPDSAIVGSDKPSNGAPSHSISPLSPPSPLKNKGGRLKTGCEVRSFMLILPVAELLALHVSARQ